MNGGRRTVGFDVAAIAAAHAVAFVHTATRAADNIDIDAAGCGCGFVFGAHRSFRPSFRLVRTALHCTAPYRTVPYCFCTSSSAGDDCVL